MILLRPALEIEQRTSTNCMWNPFLIVGWDIPVAASLPVTVLQVEVCLLRESAEVANEGLVLVLSDEGFGSGVVDIEDGGGLC